MIRISMINGKKKQNKIARKSKKRICRSRMPNRRIGKTYHSSWIRRPQQFTNFINRVCFCSISLICKTVFSFQDLTKEQLIIRLRFAQELIQRQQRILNKNEFVKKKQRKIIQDLFHTVKILL